MQISRRFRLHLSTGFHELLLDSAPGGTQYILFGSEKQMITHGVIHFDGGTLSVHPAEPTTAPLDELQRVIQRDLPPEYKLMFSALSPEN